MSTVNMLEAKSNLSRLVEAVESGAEEEIIIARNGKPAARLVPIARTKLGKRLGAAEGLFKVPPADKQLDAQIAKLFNGD
jgi:prevent-host-death family protein